MPHLTNKQAKEYLQHNVIPSFHKIVDKDLYSTIINRNLEIEICTLKSALSVGFSTWHQLKGLSYKDLENSTLAQKIFKNAYTPALREAIHIYAQKIVNLQRQVFQQQSLVSYIDLLPYNGLYKSFQTTYVPIFHPQGKVIALQSYAIECKFFNYQEYFHDFALTSSTAKLNLNTEFSERELAILFLLCNGANQEQIGEILNISRSSVAAIISNPLCGKFNIAGSNTKILTKAAIQAGIHHFMPASLWKPCIITLGVKP
jgi:hypothetical protein